MSQLKELLPFQYSVVEGDGTKLRSGVLTKIGGTFQRAEAKNANGRVYPRQLWSNILHDPDVKTRIENRRMVGLLGHPESGQSDPEKIALVVTKQELRPDNTVYGEAEILDTPMGRIADTLIRAGVGLGISSRGDGSVEKKGDADYVKNDYRFETYDLVLKPSTHGAYPEMLSECTVEKHETQVAEAIAGLVNSQNMPASQRLPVLTECLKILSVLEAQNSGNLSALTSKITEELHKNESVVVEAGEPKPELKPLPQPKQERTMNESQNRDTLAWHQQQLKAAVTEAVRAKVQEINALKNTVVTAQREHNETRKRLKAAESVIEDFVGQVKQLKEAAPSDKRLVKRYEAAVELLDEALKRLPEIGSLGRRCRTLEGLVQAGFDHISEDRKGRVVKECLSKINTKYHTAVRPVLEQCKNPEQVKKAFEALAVVSGVKPVERRRDPLPEGGGARGKGGRQPLKEDTRTPQVHPQAQSFTNFLGNRLSKALG